MATNDIGRVTPIWRGFYSDAAQYELNDIVLDADRTVWWHKGHEITVGTAPAEGDVWGAVIDMGVFGASIREAIETAQAAVAAAQEAVAEVTADTERAETAAENAEISAQNAATSAADVGAYAQAAEAAKTAAQTAQSGAEAAKTAAQTAQSGAEAAKTAAQTAKTGAEAARTGAETAASQAAGSAETASGAAAVVEQKKAEAIAAIEDKGAEVLASIPEDYTATAEAAEEAHDALFEDANNEVLWTTGAIAIANGGRTTTEDTSMVITPGTIPANTEKIIFSGTGMEYRVYAYTTSSGRVSVLDGYRGAWNGSGFVTSGTAGSWRQDDTDLGVVLAAAQAQWPNEHINRLWYRIAIRRTVSGQTEPADWSALTFYAPRECLAETVLGKMIRNSGNTGESGWSNDGLYIRYLGEAQGYSNPAVRIFAPDQASASSSGSRYILLPCAEGDKFTVTTRGGVGARAYYFVGAPVENDTTGAYAVIMCAEQNKIIRNTVLTAPANSTYLVVNDTRFPYIGFVARGIVPDTLAQSGFENAADQTTALLPVLELDDSASEKPIGGLGSKNESAENVKYSLFGLTGTCSVKWQGSSSLAYPKKNFTIKLGDKTDIFAKWLEYKEITGRGWGAQKKYCTKANWIDGSHVRNVTNARLWGQMVAARVAMGEVVDNRRNAPNYGAVDGFPIEIKINGVSQGIYTFNIPKDAWTFAMSGGAGEYVVGGESNSLAACRWRATAVTDPASPNFEADYEVEVYPETDPESDGKVAALTSLNGALAIAAAMAPYSQAATYAVGDLARYGGTVYRCRTAIGTPEPWTSDHWEATTWEAELAGHVDIGSVYDYFIFTCCTANNDAFARNILYGCYDGTEWFMSAYDLDTTYGIDPYGSKTFPIKGIRSNFAGAAAMHRLAELMVACSKPALKARYNMWRSGAAGVETDVATGRWGADGYFINMAGKAVGSSVSLTPTPASTSGSGRYIIVDCAPGDKFKVSVKGGSSARAYAFLGPESGGSAVMVGGPAAAGAELTGDILTAPDGAALLVVNDTLKNGSVYKIADVPAVLSDANVYDMFTAFGIDIPARNYALDRNIWPDMPGTSVMTIPQYMEYYRMHCAYLDAEISAM